VKDKIIHYIMKIMLEPNVYKLVYGCNTRVNHTPDKTTMNDKEVTCKNCLKKIKRRCKK